MGNYGSREANSQAESAGPAQAAGGGAAAAGGECPVPAEFRSQVYRNPAVYNVYNQRIDDAAASKEGGSLAGLLGQNVLDPRNMMPLEPNQQPCPGQKKLLSTERVQSNIPKGGTDTTWSYPSPQMFFNGGWHVVLAARLSHAAACRCCCPRAAIAFGALPCNRGVSQPAPSCTHPAVPLQP